MFETGTIVALVWVAAVACAFALWRKRPAPPAPTPPAPSYWRRLSHSARIMEQLIETARAERRRLAYHLELPCEGGPRLYVYAQGEAASFRLLELIERTPRGIFLECACGLRFQEMEELRHHQAECGDQEHTA
jgi:hypothetical protein